MMQRRCLPVAIALLACVGLSASAANWPQWRGPFLNGSTTETGLPATWSTTENIAWVTPLPGPGASTPVVWGGRVFVTALGKQPAPPPGQGAAKQAKQPRPLRDILAICLDAGTGKVLWQQPLGKNRRFMGRNDAASPSACTDGKTVWFYTGTGHLAAFDFAGTRLWARELEQDYGRFVVKWGYHSSPLLYKGKLYVPVMQNAEPTKYRCPPGREGPLECFLLAIDPTTGKTLWRHVRPTDATDESVEGYNTPIPLEGKSGSAIVLVGGECVTGHDPETGKELWRWEFVPRDRKIWQRVVSSAVTGHGLVFASRPRHRGVFALKGGGTGRLGDEWVAWKFLGPSPDATTPLLYKGRLYALDGDKKVMTCFDAKTGEQKWQGKLEARSVFRASPTGADDKIYCITEAGDAVVLAAGNEFKVLAQIKMGEGRCRATISAAGGRLFLRTARNLHCIARGVQ